MSKSFDIFPDEPRLSAIGEDELEATDEIPKMTISNPSHTSITRPKHRGSRGSGSFDHSKTKQSAAALQKQLSKSECVFDVRIYDILPFSATSVFSFTTTSVKESSSSRQKRLQDFNFVLEAVEHYIEGDSINWDNTNQKYSATEPGDSGGCVKFSIPAELLGMQYYVALTVRGSNNEKLRCRIPLQGLSCNGNYVERWHVCYDGIHGVPTRVMRVETKLSVPKGSTMNVNMRVPPLIKLSTIFKEKQNALHRYLYGKQHTITHPMSERECVLALYTGVGSLTEKVGDAAVLQITDDGALLLTTHRLIFIPHKTTTATTTTTIEETGETGEPSKLEETEDSANNISYMKRSIEIPIGMIDKLTLNHTNDTDRPMSNINGFVLDIQCTNSFSYLFYLGGGKGNRDSTDNNIGGSSRISMDSGNSISSSSSQKSLGCCGSLCADPATIDNNKYYYNLIDDLIIEIEWLRLEQSSLATKYGAAWLVDQRVEQKVEVIETKENTETKEKEITPSSKNTQAMNNETDNETDNETNNETNTSSSLTWSLRITNPINALQHEYETRQKHIMTSGQWRSTTINKLYDICESYPSYLVVPSSVSDKTIIQAAKHRSRKRLPALSWSSPITGASMCRCSQPQVGLGGKTNKSDETLLYALCKTGSNGDLITTKQTEKKNIDGKEQGTKETKEKETKEKDNTEEMVASTTTATTTTTTTTTTTSTTTTPTTTTTNNNNVTHEEQQKRKRAKSQQKWSDLKSAVLTPQDSDGSLFKVNLTPTKDSDGSRRQRRSPSFNSTGSWLQLKRQGSQINMGQGSLSKKYQRNSKSNKSNDTTTNGNGSSGTENEDMLCILNTDVNGIVNSVSINNILFVPPEKSNAIEFNATDETDKTGRERLFTEIEQVGMKRNQNKSFKHGATHRTTSSSSNEVTTDAVSSTNSLTSISSIGSMSSTSSPLRKYRKRNKLNKLKKQPISLLIADARPKLNAVANKFKGKGYEDTSSYKNEHIVLKFMGIGNIHVMRNSQKKNTYCKRKWALENVFGALQLVASCTFGSQC